MVEKKAIGTKTKRNVKKQLQLKKKKGQKIRTIYKKYKGFSSK